MEGGGFWTYLFFTLLFLPARSFKGKSGQLVGVGLVVPRVFGLKGRAGRQAPDVCGWFVHRIRYTPLLRLSPCPLGESSVAVLHVCGGVRWS